MNKLRMYQEYYRQGGGRSVTSQPSAQAMPSTPCGPAQYENPYARGSEGWDTCAERSVSLDAPLPAYASALARTVLRWLTPVADETCNKTNLSEMDGTEAEPEGLPPAPGMFRAETHSKDKVTSRARNPCLRQVFVKKPRPPMVMRLYQLRIHTAM